MLNTAEFYFMYQAFHFAKHALDLNTFEMVTK
jgi:hypothetical protein